MAISACLLSRSLRYRGGCRLQPRTHGAFFPDTRASTGDSIRSRPSRRRVRRDDRPGDRHGEGVEPRILGHDDPLGRPLLPFQAGRLPRPRVQQPCGLLCGLGRRPSIRGWEWTASTLSIGVVDPWRGRAPLQRGGCSMPLSGSWRDRNRPDPPRYVRQPLRSCHRTSIRRRAIHQAARHPGVRLHQPGAIRAHSAGISPSRSPLD